MNFSWFYRNPLRTGVLGGFALFLVYFLILSIANSPAHAIDQFIEIWPWMSALVVGFGVQIALYAFIGSHVNVPNSGIAASGGVSTASMVACCAHHIVDVLPIIGLAALSTFLFKYQTLFLLIGILSNIVGILMMLKIIKNNKINSDIPIVRAILQHDLNLAFNAGIVLSLVIIFLYAGLSYIYVWM